MNSQEQADLSMGAKAYGLAHSRSASTPASHTTGSMLLICR